MKIISIHYHIKLANEDNSQSHANNCTALHSKHFSRFHCLAMTIENTRRKKTWRNVKWMLLLLFVFHHFSSKQFIIDVRTHDISVAVWTTNFYGVFAQIWKFMFNGIPRCGEKKWWKKWNGLICHWHESHWRMDAIHVAKSMWHPIIVFIAMFKHFICRLIERSIHFSVLLHV